MTGDLYLEFLHAAVNVEIATASETGHLDDKKQRWDATEPGNFRTFDARDSTAHAHNPLAGTDAFCSPAFMLSMKG